MPIKDKRKAQKYKVATAKRRQEEHKTGFDSTSMTLPKGASFFSPKKPGVYRLSIVPYKVTKAVEKYSQRFADPGDYYNERTFYLHRVPSPTDPKKVVGYVCPMETLKGGKKCAVCDYMRKLASDPDRDAGTEALLKSMKAKQRQLFNVFDHSDPAKGVQIWDISYWLFGNYIDQKIAEADDDEREAYEAYYHPETGLQVKAGASEASNPNGTHLDFTNIEFKKRDPLDDEIVEAAYNLDELIKIPSYDEVWAVLNGEAAGDDDSGDGDDGGRKKPRKKAAEDDDEDDDPVDDEDEGEVEEDDEDAEEEGDEDGDDGEDEVGEDDVDDDGDSGDGSDDDDDGGGSEEEDDIPLAVGDRVDLTWKKREKVGKIVKINAKNGIALVRIPGVDKPQGINLDELELHEEEEDEVEEEEDDTPPPPKKKPKTPVKAIGKKKPPVEEDDDDAAFEPEDDDDDDLPPPPRKVKPSAGKKPFRR